MATAARVIKAALQRILVQASEADLEPDEYQDAIFAMNNLMLAYDAEGIQLGYTEVADLGDPVTVPTGALRGLIANLAIEVAPDYNGTVSDALVVAAREGLQVMRIIGQSMGATRYPSTLPMGSGNAEAGGAQYYPDLEAEILAETTGSIGLEVSTP
jgi:P22 tail accessory factor